MPRCFLWEDGRLTDLGTLPGGRRSIATGIDDEGRITGTSTVAGDVRDHAYLWQNGQMRDIGAFLPDAISRGVVAGAFIDTTQPVGTNRRRSLHRRGVASQGLTLFGATRVRVPRPGAEPHREGAAGPSSSSISRKSGRFSRHSGTSIELSTEISFFSS